LPKTFKLREPKSPLKRALGLISWLISWGEINVCYTYNKKAKLILTLPKNNEHRTTEP
jgi:hypothetical protein